jgi:hypothetical protein
MLAGMVFGQSKEELEAILKAVRARIKLLQATTAASKLDREQQRRLQEAQTEEAVILAEISATELNR